VGIGIPLPERAKPSGSTPRSNDPIKLTSRINLKQPQLQDNRDLLDSGSKAGKTPLDSDNR